MGHKKKGKANVIPKASLPIPEAPVIVLTPEPVAVTTPTARRHTKNTDVQHPNMAAFFGHPFSLPDVPAAHLPSKVTCAYEHPLAQIVDLALKTTRLGQLMKVAMTLEAERRAVMLDIQQKGIHQDKFAQIIGYFFDPPQETFVAKDHPGVTYMIGLLGVLCGLPINVDVDVVKRSIINFTEAYLIEVEPYVAATEVDTRITIESLDATQTESMRCILGQDLLDELMTQVDPDDLINPMLLFNSEFHTYPLRLRLAVLVKENALGFDESQISPDQPAGEHGRSLFHMAAEEGDIKAMDVLLTLGANALQLDEHHRGILHHAIMSGNARQWHAAVWIIEHDLVPLDQIDMYGMTAYHLACERDAVPVLKAIRTRGPKSRFWRKKPDGYERFIKLRNCDGFTGYDLARLSCAVAYKNVAPVALYYKDYFPRGLFPEFDMTGYEFITPYIHEPPKQSLPLMDDSTTVRSKMVDLTKEDLEATKTQIMEAVAKANTAVAELAKERAPTVEINYPAIPAGITFDDGDFESFTAVTRQSDRSKQGDDVSRGAVEAKRQRLGLRSIGDYRPAGHHRKRHYIKVRKLNPRSNIMKTECGKGFYYDSRVNTIIFVSKLE